MQPSMQCASFIRGYEKCRLVAFLPTPNDVWTIGWGHTAGVRKGDTWTQAQADATFISDLALFARGVQTAIGTAPTTQGQFDAMVSLAYNIGVPGFRSSSVLTNHRAGHYQTAALAFSLWNKQRDAAGVLHVLNGLTVRRAAEAAMYRGQ